MGPAVGVRLVDGHDTFLLARIVDHDDDVERLGPLDEAGAP